MVAPWLSCIGTLKNVLKSPTSLSSAKIQFVFNLSFHRAKEPAPYFLPLLQKNTISYVPCRPLRQSLPLLCYTSLLHYSSTQVCTEMTQPDLYILGEELLFPKMCFYNDYEGKP